jgi:hypothetical protein
MGRAHLWENMKGLDHLGGRDVNRYVICGFRKRDVTGYTEIFFIRTGTLLQVVTNCQVLYKVGKFPDFLTDCQVLVHIVNWL